MVCVGILIQIIWVFKFQDTFMKYWEADLKFTVHGLLKKKMSTKILLAPLFENNIRREEEEERRGEEEEGRGG